MNLSVYSIKKVLFQGQARLLNCKTLMGDITVLDKHENFIGVLETGVMRIVDTAEVEHFFDIKSGFFEVSQNNKVRCLIAQ